MHTKGKWSHNGTGLIISEKHHETIVGLHQLISEDGDMRDNAEYICKCVNNHERMKDTLKRIKSKINTWTPDYIQNQIGILLKDIDND